MKAMILAAGRGERMRPLTDTTPKPLLCVGGKPLIVWHLERLAAAGFRQVVINHAWLGDRIEACLQDGSRWGLQIAYSPEAPGGLETAGGIATALPLLGDHPFLVVNGDIWCDWDPARAPELARTLRSRAAQAWVLLSANPPHHPAGDFVLEPGGEPASGAPHATEVTAVFDRSARPHSPSLTFTGIGIYEPALFAGIAPHSRAPLAPLLRAAMQAGTALGSSHPSQWIDVGTPERLQQLDEAVRRAV